jgi:16S rRNA (cytosine1402-N4)-methyltransferase
MEQHITVLAKEAVEGLNITPSATIVDATLGSGGHARAILGKLGKGGTFIGLDADRSAIEALEESLSSAADTHLLNRNFRKVDKVLKELNIQNVNGILADLGWRMEQFGGGGKGFSFLIDEPLLMTFGDPKNYPFTARDIVNEWKEEDIKNVLKGYGEEKFAGRIARHIVEAREEAPIERSGELAEIIFHAVPGFYRRGRIHPATRSFQGLRIAVNDELEALEEFIKKSIAALAKEGRLAIITFHSIEDRIVKQAFRKAEAEEMGTVLTKKPITATSEELSGNPRARSAKLRIFEKVK